MTTKMTQQEMQEAWKKRKAEKKSKPTPVLTPEKYEELKDAGQSDNKIMADYGFYASKFHAWKKEHNLIGKHNVKTIQKEQSEPVELKSTTNQGESQNHTESSMEVSEHVGMIEYYKQLNERQLADNQKLAEENERLHKKLQEAAFPALEEELQKWKSDHAEMSERYIETRDDAVELSEKLVEVQCELDIRNSEYALLENQLANATKRVEDLKRIESDYQSLEALHENLKSEFNTFRARYHSIENDLEEFKDTEKMLVSTMDRYVKLYARVDEVTA